MGEMGRDWNNGTMECWSRDYQHSNFPILQPSHPYGATEGQERDRSIVFENHELDFYTLERLKRPVELHYF